MRRSVPQVERSLIEQDTLVPILQIFPQDREGALLNLAAIRCAERVHVNSLGGKDMPQPRFDYGRQHMARDKEVAVQSSLHRTASSLLVVGRHYLCLD